MRGRIWESIRADWEKLPMERSYGLPGTSSSALTSTLSTATSRTIDSQIRFDIKRLRARCRDIGQGPVVKSFKDVLLNNVLGPTGMNFQMKVKTSTLAGDKTNGDPDKQANDIIETKYKLACNRANYLASGTMTKRLADEVKLLSLVDDGEIFIRTHKAFSGNEIKFTHELIDAEQCDVEYNVGALQGGGQIRMGIEFDSWAKPVAYYFLSRIQGDYQYGQPPKNHRERVPADEVRHIFLPLKPGQSRGIPLTACAILSVRQLEAFVDAAVVNARVGAARNVYYEKQFPTGWTAGDGVKVEGDEGEIVVDLKEGEALELPYGVEAKILDTRFPDDAIEPFTRSAMRFNAMALGTSYMTLSGDLSQANFSSLRAGLNEERSLWARWQQFFIEEDCEQDFNDFLDFGLATQLIPLPASKKLKFKAATFSGRRWPSVSPLQDAAADVLNINNLLMSRSEVIRARGADPEEVLAEIANDKTNAEALGLTADKDPALQAELVQAQIQALGNNDQPTKG